MGRDELMDDEDDKDIVARLQPSQVLTLPQSGQLHSVEAVHHGPDGSLIGTS